METNNNNFEPNDEKFTEMVNLHHMDVRLDSFMKGPAMTDTKIQDFCRRSVRNASKPCKNVEVPKTTKKTRVSLTRLKVAIAGALIATTMLGIAGGLKAHDVMDYSNAYDVVITELKEDMGVETLPQLGSELDPEEQTKNINQVSDIIREIADDYNLPYEQVEENGHEFISFKNEQDQHKIMFLLYKASGNFESSQNTFEQASKYFGINGKSNYLKHYEFTSLTEYGETVSDIVKFLKEYESVLYDRVEQVKNFENIKEGSK